MTYDEPVTSLACHIRPYPLQKDAQTEARRGEELKVHRRPSEPCADSACLDFAALQHSKTLAHHSHAAFVKVAEGSRWWIANDAIENQLSCITPLLHRHLRYAWQRFAVLIEGCRVADHENLGMAGHGKIVLNANPARAVCFDVQPFDRVRTHYVCASDPRFACAAFAPDYHAFHEDVSNALSEQEADT